MALLKVITGIYNKNPGMQEMIDASMIEVCTEEDESPELVFLFCCCLYRSGYSRKNLSKSVETNDSIKWELLNSLKENGDVVGKVLN